MERIAQVHYYSRYNGESHDRFFERVNLLIRDSIVTFIQIIPETEDNILSCYVTVMERKKDYI